MSSAVKNLKNFLQFKIRILWLLAAILILYFLYFSIIHSTIPSHGFASYYTASKLLLDGGNPADFYNDNYFSSKVETYVPGIFEIYLVNLPTTTLLTLPLSGFDYKTARIIWIAINIILLAFTIWLILKRYQFKKEWLPFILILIFSFQPLYANIKYAQVYIFIFCLLIFVFWGYQSDKDKLSGIFLGLTLILKTAGGLLLILFAIQKKWKILLWILGAVILLFLVTLPLFGFDSWLAYLNKISEYASSPTLSVTAYQSLNSLFHHLFVFNPEWNPEPLFNSQWIGKFLTIFFSLSILILTIVNTYKFKNWDLTFGAFVIVGLAINPVSIDYHYVLILIPVIILINRLQINPSVFLLILFLFFYVLIALDLQYTSTKVTNGIWAIFAYPKLYGALGLLGLTLWISHSNRSIKNHSEYRSVEKE